MSLILFLVYWNFFSWHTIPFDFSDPPPKKKEENKKCKLGFVDITDDSKIKNSKLIVEKIIDKLY